MATTFLATATYSNLTRLELEALRKADFYAGSKALTVGDSALAPEGVVGKGDITAEPFDTAPEVALDDIFPITPLAQPGQSLGTRSGIAGVSAEFCQWFGPDVVYDSLASGHATAVNIWEDLTPGLDFGPAGVNVQVGDVLLVVAGTPGSSNAGVVGTVSVVGVSTLTLTNLWNPNTSLTDLDVSAAEYNYIIIRPSAVKLFAVPGSGPVGSEQTFLTVLPTTPVHNQLGPTTDDINLARIKNVVPPKYNLDSSVDRSDYVYDFPASRATLGSSLDTLGYRVVLYPDNGAGAPDLTKPISTLNPIIDPAIPSTDQRFTIDYKAGVIRFSCAPATGGDIKPLAGCVNPATGRLNLYATFWIVDLSLTQGNARSLYAVRTTTTTPKSPGRVTFDTASNAWQIGATGASTNPFFVRAIGALEGSTNAYATTRYSTEFGTVEATLPSQARYFSYTPGSNTWKFVRSNGWSNLGPADAEMVVADKTALTVSDMSNPAMGQAGDLYPTQTLENLPYYGYGARNTTDPLAALAPTLMSSSWGTAHLRKGRYFIADKTIHVPPGSTIQGEGPGTKIFAVRNRRSNILNSAHPIRPVFKVGPNTTWGVWDPTAVPVLESLTNEDNYNVQISPSTTALSMDSTAVLGMDLVWNPVRRVWGQVVAVDNGVWFNEVDTAGNYKFPGLGIDVKTSVAALFSPTSTGAEYHTPGHYPRIAFHEHSDKYGIVWVEEVTIGGFTGPQVHVRGLRVEFDADNNSTVVFDSASSFALDGARFTDHPSIAIESYNYNELNFFTLVCCWSYLKSATGLTSSRLSRYRLNGVNSVSASSNLSVNSAKEIISSTDVAWSRDLVFQTVYSVRCHIVASGTQGVISSGAFSDPSFTPSDPGIISGSKLHILGGAVAASGLNEPLPQTQNGQTFTVQEVSGSVMTLWSDLGYGAIAEAGPLRWAITPPSYIRAIQDSFNTAGLFAFGLSATDVVNAKFNTGSTARDYLNYTLEMEEPDFVRVSRGQDNWIVVFQGFASHAHLSQSTFRDFSDASKSGVASLTSTIDGGALDVYREHVSTCRVILADSQTSIAGITSQVVYPVSSASRMVNGLSFGNVPTGALVTHSHVLVSGTGSIVAGTSVLNDVGANFDNAYVEVTPTTNYTGLPGGRFLLIKTGGNQAIYSVTTQTNNSVTIFGTFPVTDGTAQYAFFVRPASSTQRLSHDIEISKKSLGTRESLTHRPNFQSNDRRPFDWSRELSPLNYSYRWTATQPVSLIPAVTWTGSDWVVVSPVKNRIHSMTGYYQPNGGNSLLSDVGFYFGRDAAGSAGTTLGALLKTLPTSGVQVYFPSTGTYHAVGVSYDEHTVQLSGQPLGAGTSSQVEYFLIFPDSSTSPFGSNPDRAMFKHQGYRIAADGQVISSTSFNTFRGLPDEDKASNYANARELMRRVYDYTGGGNWPNVNYTNELVNYDYLEPGSHYRKDVHFKGVAPGRPKGMNELANTEPPMVALAWGDNYYGMLDHVVAGPPGFRLNQLEFYRQSFGPYNVTIKDLAIESRDSLTSTNLKVLSRSHVYTKNGGPSSGTVSVATDGYKNVYVYPSQFYGMLIVEASPPIGNSFKNISTLRACVATAQGQDPIHLDVSHVGGNNTLRNYFEWSEGLAHIRSTDYSLLPFFTRYFDQNVTSKVIWDGRRYVAVWVSRFMRNQYSDGLYGTQISIGYVPGSENDGVQGPEIGSPNSDYASFLSPLATAFIPSGDVGGSVGTLTSPRVAIDVAFSGSTYAVLWVAGCFPDPSTNANDQGSSVGVTIFRLDTHQTSNFNTSAGLRMSSGGGQTYVLDQHSASGYWQNPRILWDGEKYAIFVQQTTSPGFSPLAAGAAGNSDVLISYVGENGPAHPVQVKQQSGRWTGFDGPKDYFIAGASVPIVSGSPLYPASDSGEYLIGIGYPVTTGQDTSAAPTSQQYYTEIIMPGGGHSGPLHASGSGGSRLSATQFQVGVGVDFEQGLQKVLPGDILVIDDPTGGVNYDTGVYVIASASANVVTISKGTLTSATASMAWAVYRPNHSLVSPGDTLVVDGVSNNGGTVSVNSVGHYPVRSYNPRTRIMTVEGRFSSGDINTNKPSRLVIRGSVRSGSVANSGLSALSPSARSGSITQPTSSAGGSNAGTLNIQYQWTTPSWLSDGFLSYGPRTGYTDNLIHTLHDVVYNSDRDEYAILFSSGGGQTTDVANSLWVTTYNPNRRIFGPSSPLYYNLNAVPTSFRIAWNGRNYMVAGSIFDPSAFSVRMVAYVLSVDLAIETAIDPIDTISSSGTAIIDNGNASVPGSGYGSFPGLVTTKGVYTSARSVNLFWNSLSSRWVLTANVAWMPNDISSTATLKSSPYLAGTVNTISSAGVITLATGDTNRILPGMKVLFGFSVVGLDTYYGFATVLDVQNSTTFTVDANSTQAARPSIGYPAASPSAAIAAGMDVYVLPREDVFTWTLGYNSAGILIEDADGVVVENVTMTGSTADIVEVYRNMTRPIWQAAGKPAGSRYSGTNYFPLISGSITASHHNPQYNYFFQNPSKRTSTTLLTNVRTSTKMKHRNPKAKG